jgi:hypothetical protein
MKPVTRLGVYTLIRHAQRALGGSRLALLLVAIVAACGGSPDESPSGPTPPPSTLTGWQGPQLLSGDAPIQLQLVGNSQGAALALWKTDPAAAIRVLPFDQSTGWGQVETLAEGIGGGSFARPDVALSRTGSAIVSWFDFDRHVYVRRRPTGRAPWGTASSIDAGTRSPEHASVGMDDDGNAVVAWASNPGGAWVRRSPPVGGWEPAVQLLDGPYSSLTLAIAGRGLATLLWGNCASHFPTSGTLIAELDCADFRLGFGALAAATPEGRTLILVPGLDTTWAQWWVPGEGWTEIAALGSNQAPSPALDVDARGNAYVLRAPLREGRLEGYRFDSGGGWGAPQGLATPDPTEVWAPSVALDDGEGGLGRSGSRSVGAVDSSWLVGTYRARDGLRKRRS